MLAVQLGGEAQEHSVSSPEGFQSRLDQQQVVPSAVLKLTDFVGFVATTFKVPMLVEAISPVPALTVPGGAYSARRLLDLAVQRWPDYEWKDEQGVAHLYHKRLLSSDGNLLNIRVHRFRSPNNVAEFLYSFRACLGSTIRGYSCEVGAFSGFILRSLETESLPAMEFKDSLAREILLKALQENRHFFTIIAFESSHPKLISDFPFLNWFSQSLVLSTPDPMWIQIPHDEPSTLGKRRNPR